MVNGGAAVARVRDIDTASPDAYRGSRMGQGCVALDLASLVLPAVVAVAVALLVGFGLGPVALGALLIGLIVSGGMKIYGEASGSSKLEGRAKATAKEIAKQLESRFRDEGWIE